MDCRVEPGNDDSTAGSTRARKMLYCAPMPAARMSFARLAMSVRLGDGGDPRSALITIRNSSVIREIAQASRARWRVDAAALTPRRFRTIQVRPQDLPGPLRYAERAANGPREPPLACSLGGSTRCGKRHGRHEAAGVRHAARRRGGGRNVAARGARAAGVTGAHRLP
jgi:hypothetical protein